LFKFLEDASIRRNDQPAIPTDILNLNQAENDIFIDIFTNTYSKIVAALAKKAEKQKITKKKSSILSSDNVPKTLVRATTNFMRN